MDKLEELKQRTAVLSAAAKAYYVENKEQMSNIEYDRLYDELVALEQETGVVLAQSPTITVGYETVSTLPKEQHSRRMLSLDKTKSVEDLVAFAGNHPCLLSWKLDGLTVVLTYEEGRLQKAVTRGNGEVGEVVTGNARMFSNLPVTIPWKERIVLRGEAIISYSDFERINQELPEIDAKYKNPRNLCSGSVRQLNNEITAERKVRFIAFALVEGEEGSRGAQLEWLAAQGFEVVAYRQVDGETLPEAVNAFAKEVESEDYPSDGLVLTYDDIAYGKSLGETAKFPRDAIAFKWQDERKETLLKEIEWSVSRTGLINPIAVFEPVELEGTTVSRAGVHNVSILKELKLGIGDEIQVYKANMIIPQIAKNIT
ncbi:MAG: NAD-dependent DNA ligase LigA, partial [Anaerovoracaceae bacterium]